MYVISDAGREPSLHPERREQGGVGLVFVTECCRRRTVPWGIPVVMGYNTHLEWVTKILALLLLHDYAGQFYMSCDNTTVHLCELTR